MSSTTQRMLTTESGKRVSLKLDQPTWQTVDWLASQHGISWQEWCNMELAEVSEGENMTAALREAAMSGLLGATIWVDRGEQLAAMANHPLLRESGMLGEPDLQSILKRAQVQGRSHFGGFEVIFGFDEHGQDCVWIRNGMRDGMHFAFVLPN